MKTNILTIIAAMLLHGCANPDAGYWQARQQAAASLPAEQRQAAEIDLMRDQHADVELQRQRMIDIVNSSIR